MRRLLAAMLLLIIVAPLAHALDWITLAPNGAYSRDFSMGASTVALPYAPQSQSINPAGLSFYNVRTERRAILLLNPGGFWQLNNYRRDMPDSRAVGAQITDGLRLVTAGAALQTNILNVVALLSQPVMHRNDSIRYRDYDRHTPLPEHQNSLAFSLALHPRVSVGGRIDRYYRGDLPGGEGYSYGVILRPRGVSVGVQYQHYPVSGVRIWHPLDRRSHESTNAGVAVVRDNLTVTVEVMNLTQSANPAFLEPHAGMEWRLARAIALRAGGTQFSRSRCWAWTAGLGLLDANWLRARSERWRIPDDIVQLGVGVIYNRRVPVQGITSLTFAWHF